MNPGNSPYTVQAEDHARAVVDQMGRQRQTWGSWWHALQYWVDVTGPSAVIMGPIARCKLYNMMKAREEA